ncbi:hypothetical protein QQZ08_000357 [Neonectria magnoliae]|uniref:Uncharacterized protein n=1 Tax=Neonectria magnoliae TaxID=2732573 RepID=A0ABR1IJM0_9HYPO
MNTAGQACEDVKIHAPSSTAFLACGYPLDRLQFYPSAGRYNFSTERKHLEYFIKYEIETNTTIRLEIEGWSGDEDLVLHGLDIWQPAGDASQIYIYAVNHGRTGESILLFSHVLGTSSIRFINKFSHSFIKTPNEVAAAGERSFFVSNDHYYYGGKLRDLEDAYGPFNWASNVVYCEEKNSGTDCRVVTPKNSHPWANGLALVDEGKSLLVNDIVDGTTTVYDVDPSTKKLKHRKTIFIGATPDNISEEPGTGNLITAVVPNLANTGARMFGNDPVNYEALVEAAVIRLVKSKSYEPELLYWDDGSLVSIMTGAAYDPRHKKLIGTGIWERHFIVCHVE